MLRTMPMHASISPVIFNKPCALIYLEIERVNLG